jgi:hypothetical protein
MSTKSIYSPHGASTTDRIAHAIEHVSVPNDRAGVATREIMRNIFNRNGFTRLFLICVDRDAQEPTEMHVVNDMATSIYDHVQGSGDAKAVDTFKDHDLAPAPAPAPVPGTLPLSSEVVESRPSKKRARKNDEILRAH